MNPNRKPIRCRCGPRSARFPACPAAGFAILLFGIGLAGGPLASAQSGNTPELRLDDIPARGADELSQALLDCRNTEADGEELTLLFARGGPESIPQLFALFERGRFDVRVGKRGNSTRTLSPAEREALVAALGVLPWSRVQAFLEELGTEPCDETRRLAVLELLGAHGTSGDLSALLHWSEPGPAEGRARVPRARSDAFGAALGALLERNPAAWHAVPDLYGRAHLCLVPGIASTLGEHPDATSLSVLTQLLGLIPAADPLVLAEICHVAAAVRPPVEERVRDRVRPLLDSGDHTLLFEGILAVGRLEDAKAVPQLLELMEHPDRLVRKRAEDALGQITRQHLGADPEEWIHWYADAQDWWQRLAQEQLQQVRSRKKVDTKRAILELSKRRFFRHELAAPLAEALQHSDEEVVELTCATLGHLGSPLSVPPLLECLEDARSIDIRRAALLSLRRITGEDHGEDPLSWRTAGW